MTVADRVEASRLFHAGPHSGVYALGWEVGDVDAGAALMQGFGLAVEPVDASDVAYELRAAGARHWLCRT